MCKPHALRDAAVRAVAVAARQLQWSDVRLDVCRMRQSLEWHLQAEEMQLFPAFGLATGMVRGRMAVMRRDHRQIRELLE